MQLFPDLPPGAQSDYNGIPMPTLTLSTGWLKLVIGWVAVFLIRLLPFRPANFEPMLATMMPFATRFGYFASFLFGFFGIVLFDAVTSGIGIWTLVTAAAYGALGIGAHLYFRTREATTRNFLTFGVTGTVLYDIITGLTTGPIFFNQPFMVALIGQIPFTLMHVLGTVIFTLALSPVLYRWVVKNDKLEVSLNLNRATG